jgi:penicillin-binding protein 1A
MKRLVLFTFLWILLFLSLFAGVTGILMKVFIDELPTMDRLESMEPVQMSRIFSSDGSLIGEFYRQKRILTNYDKFPPYLICAFVSVEDREFFHHWGLDMKGITRAFVKNLMAGGIVQGGSSITQQLSRNLFLSHERTLSRKIKEILLTIKIERLYSKEEILEYYLNQIYFGHGAYGVEAASMSFFGKHAEELSLAEAALLAGIPRSPAYYSPIDHPSRAVQRRNLILQIMRENNCITVEQHAEARDESLATRDRVESVNRAPYFAEMIRKDLENRYTSDLIYREGLNIHTTLDLKMQETAERVLEEHLLRQEEKMNYFITRQDFDSLEVITAEYDTTCSGSPRSYIQGALLAIDPGNGYVRAMVGGRSFAHSQFNRTKQAKRQAGSAFKPVVFLTAFENGFTPSDIILDAPIVLETGDGELWKPENYTQEFHGSTTLRDGLKYSRNIVAIKLAMKVGIPKIIERARSLGLRGALPEVYSLAIGSGEVSLWELVSMYSSFANAGIQVKPIYILSIENQQGKILETFTPDKKEVISEQLAYLLTTQLQSVLDGGTGYPARLWGFTRPAAGKTGTTDNTVDSWFIGYTPRIVAGVWCGFDDNYSLGPKQSGSVVALPIWTEFMKQILNDSTIVTFRVPDGVVTHEVCEKSGFLASPFCPVRYTETFLLGSEPKRFCDVHVKSNLEDQAQDMPLSGDSESAWKDGLDF